MRAAMRTVLALSFVVVLSGCGSTAPAAGETLCGAGTTLQGNTCVATSAGATCGPGTVLSGTQCVPAGATVTCGEGTTLTDGRCVAGGATVTCGAGTTLQGTTCVATSGGATCGTGTVLRNGACVVDTSTRRGFRDSCIVNADCGCYANMADDPTCAVTGGDRLICKAGKCTLDCGSTSYCTSIFPVGTQCATYGAYCQ